MLAGVSVFGGVAQAADEPGLHQIYQAADAGRLDEAQSMMRQVLQAHPNSGKAHYVEAELLAKQGDFSRAREELAKAQSLAPGLPFAKPQAVENLKTLLEGSSATRANNLPVAHAQPVEHSSSFPWGLFLTGLGLIAFIVVVARVMSQRAGPSASYVPAGHAEPVPAGYTPYGASYNGGAPGYAPGYNPQPGMGSRIMGGLATGAAVGAGVVAGEAIARHFMGGQDNSQPFSSASNNIDLAPSSGDLFNDMGGQDFGIADTSSWDDGGGSDNEWN
jgi:hypothetical protein